MSRLGRTALLFLVVLFGCDVHPVEPGGDSGLAGLRLVVAAASQADVDLIGDRVTGVRLAIHRPDGGVRTVVLPLPEPGPGLAMLTPLDPAEMVERLEIEVELVAASVALYQGSAVVNAATEGTVSARVDVSPVVGGVEILSTSPTFDAFGEARKLSAVVRFPDGVAIPGVAPDWRSEDSGVIRMEGDTAVSVGNGTVDLSASYGFHTATTNAGVMQVPVEIHRFHPERVTLSVFDTRGFAVEGVDRNGFALEDGAGGFDWELHPGEVGAVSESGRILGLRPGLATVQARLGGASLTVEVRARGPGDPPPLAWSGVRVGDPLQSETLADGTMPTWAPDRSEIVFVRESDLYAVTPAGAERPVYQGPLRAAWPEYSADGVWIHFVTTEYPGGPTSLHRIRPDGSGLALVFEGVGRPSVSPDGQTVVYDRVHSILSWSFERGRQVFVDDALGPGAPEWSPDGRWVAYTRNHALRLATSGGAVRTIDAGFMHEALSWSPDSAFLLGTNRSGGVVVVVDTGQVIHFDWPARGGEVAWWR